MFPYNRYGVDFDFAYDHYSPVTPTPLPFYPDTQPVSPVEGFISPPGRVRAALVSCQVLVALTND